MNGLAGPEANGVAVDALAASGLHLVLGRETDLLSLFEELGICTFVGDPNGRSLYVSPLVARMTGYEPDDFTSTTGFWASRLHPDDRAATLASYATVTGDDVLQLVYRWRVASGEYRWFYETSRRVPDRPGWVVGIWHDVKGTPQAELDARIAASRVEYLLAHMHGGVMLTDEDRSIQLINQDFLELFTLQDDATALRGTSAQRLLERVRSRLVDPAEFMARIDAILAAGAPVLAEEVMLADGRVLERDFIPIFDIPGGRANLWHYRDVTTRKLAEQQLRSTNVELEERVARRTRELDAANERLQEQLDALQATEAQLRASLHDKEVLLREVHHRVKNNLQVITSILRLQSQHLPPGMERDTLVAAIGRVRSMALVHELLYQTADLARIDLGRYLGRLLEQIAQAYPAAERVRLEIAAAIVPASIELALPLGLIAVELVTNALRHAFPEPTEGHIRVAVTDEADAGLVLSVTDDGVGFAATSGRNEQAESGLGLDLVNALVRQLRATLAREHGPGGDVGAGTRYTIRIPRDFHV